MKLQHLLPSAAMASLILMAPEMHAMKRVAIPSQDAPPSTATMKKKSEEKAGKNSSSKTQEKEKEKEEKIVDISLSSSSEDEEEPKKEEKQKEYYSWGSYLTNVYFHATANPIHEKQKFPDIKPSDILKHMKEGITVEEAQSISFPFTTGSSVSAPDYYKGIALVDEIDFGTYRVPFLGTDKGFDPHATYISQVREVSPYTFIQDAFIKTQCDGTMCKGDLLKGIDSKTRLVYVFHNETDNLYLRLILKRDRGEK